MILQYYFSDGTHVIFDKYTINLSGIIHSKKTEKEIGYRISNGYYKASVYDNDGKQRSISVARAVASTFLGKPPTMHHTADHIVSDQKLNNNVSNIRWASKSEQVVNRTMPDTIKSAFIITKGCEQFTAKEWVAHLTGIKNPFGRYYTYSIITQYAQKKQHGFAYEEPPDLIGEIWKQIDNSKTQKGQWEISNMNRVRYVTKYASKVLSGEQLGMANGYPCIGINGKQKHCHILSFDAFNSGVLRGDLMVLHKNDNRLDFRPENLRLGTARDNGKDAHDNGKHDGTKTSRMRCASFINGILEKEFDSLSDAAAYLWTNGYPKAKYTNISMVLSGINNTTCGRLWKKL